MLGACSSISTPDPRAPDADRTFWLGEVPKVAGASGSGEMLDYALGLRVLQDSGLLMDLPVHIDDGVEADWVGVVRTLSSIERESNTGH